MSPKRTYLDFNASAPLRPEAREAMLDALDIGGNPSSVHAEGRRARKLVDEAREAVARLVNADPSEVVFTSGATEANNWALSAPWRQVAVANIEHDSVRVPLAHIAAAREATVMDFKVSGDGSVDFRSALPEPGAVVVLQAANNETGVLQNLETAGLWVTERGARLHTDAVQAAGRVAIDFKSIGASTLALSGHKIGGPKGIGALVIGKGAELPPMVLGGGQEGRHRAGTENVAAIAGFGAAANAAREELAEMPRVAAMRDRLEAEVLRQTPGAVVIGKNAPRLANTSCIALPGQSAETLVIKLDLAGIAVSAGAACSSGKVGTSHVLAAMGLAPEVAKSAIRISIGASTTEEDVAAFLAAWKRVAGSKELAA